MLIVNSKQLLNNPAKDSEIYIYAKEYQDGVRELQTRFPTGMIQLKREGYPRLNKLPDGTAALPEIPPPIFINLTRTVDGVTWGYCKSRPLIHANGLVEVPPNDNSEMINDEIYHIDLKSKPDYAFYIMYKSGILGSQYKVFDPEGDKLKELTEKNAKLKVQSLIRDMDDDKLRMMCQAWGISGAGTKNPLLLQEEIENKVFTMDEHKKRNKTDLMAKGIDEFLAEARNDEVTRPKAIIQYGLDEKRITFNPSQSRFYFDETEICYVPIDRQSTRVEFLAQVLRNPDHREKWQSILKALLTKEYIEKMDKYGVRWLASQLDVALNQKEADLRTALLSEFNQ